MRERPYRSCRLPLRPLVAGLLAGLWLLASGPIGTSVTGQTSVDEARRAGWTLLYAEDFSTPLNGAVSPWVKDGAEAPFDTIMDDAGLWYQNDYGPDWATAFNSFDT